MTSAKRAYCQMAMSPSYAFLCVRVSVRHQVDGRRTLKPRTTSVDLVFPLRLALARALASRRDPTPVPVERNPPIQSP